MPILIDWKICQLGTSLDNHNISTSQMDGHTDRDRETTCHGNAALCIAPRGKNCDQLFNICISFCNKPTVNQKY